MVISGHTRFLAHLGVPTESFKAPMIYNPWFEQSGIDAVVVPMGCEAEEFPVFFKSLMRLRNIVGALITMPHKISVVGLVDEITTTVKICGSSNAVRKNADGTLTADMFDGEGFARGVLSKGRTIQGASVIVVGSGGVGSAIAASLAKAGTARMTLFDTNQDSCNRLAERLKQHYPQIEITTGSNDPAGHDIVVNATPLGMNAGDPLPMDTDRIDPSAFVGEVVMKAEQTRFLAAASERGCVTQVGTDMLFEMIPAYLEFFGYPPATPDELRKVATIRY